MPTPIDIQWLQKYVLQAIDIQWLQTHNTKLHIKSFFIKSLLTKNNIVYQCFTRSYKINFKTKSYGNMVSFALLQCNHCLSMFGTKLQKLQNFFGIYRKFYIIKQSQKI